MALAAYYSERALHMPFGGDDAIAASGPGLRRHRHRYGVLAVSAHLLRIEEFTQFRRRRVALLNVVDST